MKIIKIENRKSLEVLSNKIQNKTKTKLRQDNTSRKYNTSQVNTARQKNNILNYYTYSTKNNNGKTTKLNNTVDLNIDNTLTKLSKHLTSSKVTGQGFLIRRGEQ